MPLLEGYGKLAAVFTPDFRVRRTLALLPLPLCIALSLQARADERKPDWSLCPVDDAVPAFTDAQTSATSPEARAQLPTNIEGDQATGTAEQPVLSGNVALTRGDQFLGTDHLNYDSNTGHYQASGHVRYQDAGMRLTAESAEGDQNIDSHDIRNVRYQLIERRGNGGAEQIQLQGTQGALYDSTYSTCPPSQRKWELQADRIDIDTAKGEGVARNAVLRVGRVPVLYVPYFPFPIDDRRRTGLLYPAIGFNSKNGFDWRQPIYFNLAPNYDDTLTPRLMTERGLWLGNEFRYLIPGGKGQLDLAFMPDDRLQSRKADEEEDEFREHGYDLDNRRKKDRGRFAFKGTQNLSDTWQARANLNWISDPRYLEDFSSNLNGLAPYSLISSLGVYGRGRYWDAGLAVDHKQLADYTLHDYNLPYDRLPRLFANWEQPFRRWFAAGVHAEAVRFEHVDDTQQVGRVTDDVALRYDRKPGGNRLDLKPYITLPLEGSSWFIRPTLAWRYTAYQLDDDMAQAIAYGRASAYASDTGEPLTSGLVASFLDDRPTRSMPITSLDAGLFFDRDTSFGGKAFLQTLEPRLFYLRAPYRDQDALPRFDTSSMTFSWGQLFRDNRFTGADRQMDANQLTMALTTRLIRQSDGKEKLSASIGQIRYFDDSRVDLAIGGNGIPQGKSAWVADANYAFNDRWTMGASYQWDPKDSKANLISVRSQYLVGDEGIVNLGYRYRRSSSTATAQGVDQLKQVDFSFLYPVSPSWSIIGRYYYSLLDRRKADPDLKPTLLEGILGVQWDSCCLAARVFARRYVRNRTGELNDQIQFELELKGLGSAGQDTERRLRRAILGYDRDDLYLVPPPQAATGDDGDDDDSLLDPTTP